MNFGDLFDSPWKIAIIAIFFVVMFGSRKLPSAARSLGQSMRILKREVQGLHEDEPESGTSAADATAQAAPAPAQIAAAPAAAPAVSDQQAQIDALQQQIRDMQRTTAMDPVASGKQDTVTQQS